MKKLISWLLGTLVTLVVLLLAAIVIIPMVVDPNDYRDEITKLVREKTGRELQLAGDLKLSVVPWLGIKTQGLSFSQPAEIGGEMISVDTAQLRVKLVPLLSQRVEIDTIVLTKPSIRLVTLKSGVDSFTGLGADESTTVESAANEESAASDEASTAVALVVQGIELTDGRVLIDDQSAGSRTEISDLNLLTGDLLGDDLADINASGTLLTSDSPDATNFSLNAKAKIDVATLLVNMADLQAQVTQGELELGLNVDTLTFADSAALNLDNLSLSVQGPISARMTAPSVRADLNSQRAEIPSLDASAFDFTATLSNLIATQFIDAPAASGKLIVPSFNAAKLLKDLEVDYQTQDSAALKNVALNAEFSGSLNGAQVKNLALTLDDSQLTGSAGVSNFDKPNATFDLSLTKLNLDRYLPPSTEESAVEEPAGGPQALAVPMAVFEQINANGQFKAEQLIASGLVMDNIDVQVRSSAGQVTITPRASLYDGSLDGQIAFTNSGGVQKLAVNNEIGLVQLGKMLTDVDVTDQLSGIGTLLIDLVVTEVDGKQTNNGVIKLQARDGSVKGVDIKGMVDTAYAKYQSLSGKEPSGDEVGQSEKSDETKFAELLGTFNVNNNVITNNDFSMKAPLFRVGGAGTIDIEKQILDYLVEVKIVASTDGQGGEAMENLVGIPIPIRFTGNLTDPKYAIDFKRMYKALFAREVDRKKGELLQEKLGIEGGEELSTKDVLKGVLGQKLDKRLNKKDGAQEKPLTERGESPAEIEKSPKEKQKEELKNKLLDGLFGK